MTIRNKLTFLVGGSLLSFVLAASAYFLALAPAAKMEAEGQTFTNLAQKSLKLRSEAAFLTIIDLENQAMVFDQAKSDWEEAQNQIEQIHYLPKANATLADAVQTTINLKSLVQEAFGQMDLAMHDISESITRLKLKEGQRTIPAMLNAGEVLLVSKTDADQLKVTASTLYKAVGNLNEIFGIQISTLTWQDQIIQAELAKVRNRSMAIAIAFVILIIASMMALSLLTAKSIAHSLSFMDETIKQMSGGDLSGHFDTSKKDEMGSLAKNLNSFVETLNKSLETIQTTARENARLREELIGSVEETTSSTTQIGANALSIRTQMEQMDHLIIEATQKVSSTVKTLTDFHIKLANQNEHIEQSVAAVTEMLASIGNISRIVDLDRELGSALVAESNTGAEVLDDSFNKVAEVSQSVHVIEEMADLIAAIANQTNLLSMNAAIEAAHAGEAGKGFAVVADEINKLASASAESSAEIAKTIKMVTRQIQEANSTKDRTSEAFNAITNRIKEVTRSIEEIYTNVSEMQAGSRQILTAMESLKSGSKVITGESLVIEQESRNVQSAFDTVGRVSTEVVSNIKEISIGLADISKNVHQVADRAEAVGVLGLQLETSVESFKLKSTSQSAGDEII